ncbi:MAG: acetylglutamate kinase [Myxococcales bacterium]|nr:acetylglutamate kinase [Myxococcales bacterium]
MTATIVVKLGGETVGGPVGAAVAADVAALAAGGARVVVVHGGGPQATALQKSLGLVPNIVGGRRITDAATLDVMKMAVAGKVNVDLCGQLMAAGARPVGLHGASSAVVRAVKRPPRVVSGGGPDPIDFGLVGDIAGFDLALLALLGAAGYVPVLACLAADAHGQALNVNADIVANQVAGALGAAHLVLVTSTSGVLRDVKDPASRLRTLTVAEAKAAIVDGTVTGGMIPKLEESMAALADGRVGAIHIVGEVAPGDLVRELAEAGAVGTALTR